VQKPIGTMTFLLLLSGTCLAQAGDLAVQTDATGEVTPYTSLDLNNDPEVFRFAVVSDNAGGPRQGIFAEAMAKLNLLQPEFVVGVGDYIEGYEDTAEQLNIQWERFMADIAPLEVPLFLVPGNHDMGRPLWNEVYKARFGRTYYHFVYKNVLFLCLATNDGPNNGTGIGPEQIAYAARVLAEHPDVRWTLVFQHKPLWNDEKDEGWKQLAGLLAGRKCTVFCGHTHEYLSQERDGISFITLATTGGGSPLRGPAYGEFDQIAWVTMTDDGPRVADVLLDGILSPDLRTPEKAQELRLFVANRAVTATPVQVEGDLFESGVSTLSITNPSQQPLRIKVLSEMAPGIRVSPGSVSRVIPPDSKQEIALRISAEEGMPVAAVQPVILHWTAYYDTHTNKPSVELAGQCGIPIDAPFVIARRDTAPVIDGKLDDWAALPFVVDQPTDIFFNVPAWKGPQDGAFRFAVSYDDAYLYVAMQATDDERCFEGWKYWEDFAILSVDARASGSDDPRTAMFNLSAGPGMTREQARGFEEGAVPEGVQCASVPTTDGFTAELAIPAAYLNERQDGRWKRVRLNVAFADFDTGDQRDGVTILNWRPEWLRSRGNVETGVFLREATNK